MKRPTLKVKERIGWREWVALPDLQIPAIKAKIDTGARSSALHAIRLRHFEREGHDWVTFQVHPFPRHSKDTVVCEAPVIEFSSIRSSNGRAEVRPKIKTLWGVGESLFQIEVTLTNRAQMGFPLLIGREALRKRFLVDVASSFVFGQPEFVKKRRRKAKP